MTGEHDRSDRQALPYQLVSTADGVVARVGLRGRSLLAAPMLNRGTAFTPSEREALGLTGLLPDAVSTMEGQLARVYGQYRRQPDELAKNLYLAGLRDRKRGAVLPATDRAHRGNAADRLHPDDRDRDRAVQLRVRPRAAVYLSVDHPDQIEVAFRNYGLGPDDVDLIVATDAEGILGIGDWGAGGIAIAIGKLAVYVAAAGLHPGQVIPVVLDTGTDNAALLAEDMYVGARHPRVRGERYDQLIDAYVATATRMFPGAMLHWEDFGAANAHRILARYAGSCCTFNDDMQGTAAVVLAAAMAAVRAAGTRMRDQTIVIHGAGTAGTGIANVLRQAMIAEGLPADQATSRFWALSSRGLLTSDHADTMHDFQVPYVRPAAEVASWERDRDGRIELAEVVARTRPTILIGTSTQPGVFSEPIVTTMAAGTERPIIMPLSNPTSLSEAQPADLIAWTGGRALIATGSPFKPVTCGDVRYTIAQANNALRFPGLGLGVTVARARRVSDGMLAAAAAALAGLSDATTLGAVLPTVTRLREVSATVAVAVVRAAQAKGLAQVQLDDPVKQVAQAMWTPSYPSIELL